MGPTWVLSAPEGPHVGPMNIAIRGSIMPYKVTKPQWVNSCIGCRLLCYGCAIGFIYWCKQCKVTGACHLVAISGATILVPCHVVKSLQLIWSPGTCRWNLQVPNLQMSHSDLTWWQGTRMVPCHQVFEFEFEFDGIPSNGCQSDMAYHIEYCCYDVVRMQTHPNQHKQ